MRCVWYYHDGGKSCETCQCPAQVALRVAAKKNQCVNGRKRHSWYGERCLYCPAIRYEDSYQIRRGA